MFKLMDLHILPCEAKSIYLHYWANAAASQCSREKWKICVYWAIYV